MTWNIFKRVAVLEKEIANLRHDLVTQYQALSMLHNQMRAKYPPSEVDKEREARRLYHRAWRAKNKLSSEERDKKRAYARAYYARTKGAKK